MTAHEQEELNRIKEERKKEKELKKA